MTPCNRQHESFVWTGWVLAVALLGLEALSDVVRQAFRRGLIDPMVMSYDDFCQDLGRTLADPKRMVGFHHDRIGPLKDAIGELSSWYAFSDAAKRDQERRATTSWGCPPVPCRYAPSFCRPVQGSRPKRSLSMWQR